MLPMAELAADAPARKDVVVGALGASSALAGLILIFLAVVISTYQRLFGAPPQAGNPHRRAVTGIMAVFCLGLLGTAMGLLWLITSGGGLLYAAVIATFFVQLATVLVVAFYTTYRVLL